MLNSAPDNFKLVPPTGAQHPPLSDITDHTDLPTLTERVNPVHDEQLHLTDIPLPPAGETPSLINLRLQKGQSIGAAAAALRLKPAQIHALEAKDWAALPGTAYIKGFLRSYCRFLNVAPEAYLAQYDASIQVAVADSTLPNQAPLVLQKDPTALSSFNAAGHQNESHKTLFSLLGLLIVGTVAFVLFWERAAWLPSLMSAIQPSINWVSQRIEARPAPSAADVKAVSSAGAPQAKAADGALNSAISPAMTTASAPSPSPLPEGLLAKVGAPVDGALNSAENQASSAATGPLRTLNLKVDKTVWLEVRDSGNNVIYTGMRSAGVNDTIQGAAPLNVTIGAADAVTLLVDGRAIDVIAQAKQNVAKFNIQ